MNKQRAYNLAQKLKAAISSVKDPRTVFELSGVYYDAQSGDEMTADEVRERPLIHLADKLEMQI